MIGTKENTMATTQEVISLLTPELMQQIATMCQATQSQIEIQDTSKRRDNGSGSIYQNKKGKWVAQVIYYDENHERKKATRTAYTKKEAYKLLEFLRGEYEDFNASDVKNIPVKELIKQYLVYKKRDVSIVSYHRICQTINTDIISQIGDMALKDVTLAVLNKKVIYPAIDRGLGHSSVKKIKNSLTNFFEWCRKNFEYPKNPARDIDLKATMFDSVTDVDDDDFSFDDDDFDCDYDKIPPFTENEVEVITTTALATYKNGKLIYPNGHIFTFAVETGLRCAELLGLQWRSVKLGETAEDSFVFVRKTLVELPKKTNGERLILQDKTKTRSSKRKIPMSDKAFECLQFQMKCQQDEGVFNADGFVFGGIKPISPSNIRRTLKTIEHKTETATDKGMHSFRHTFATRLYANNVKELVIMKLMGHIAKTVTSRYYIKVSRDELFDAINTLNK